MQIIANNPPTLATPSPSQNTHLMHRIRTVPSFC